jgi:hypothetical protein
MSHAIPSTRGHRRPAVAVAGKRRPCASTAACARGGERRSHHPEQPGRRFDEPAEARGRARAIRSGIEGRPLAGRRAGESSHRDDGAAALRTGTTDSRRGREGRPVQRPCLVQPRPAGAHARRRRHRAGSLRPRHGALPHRPVRALFRRPDQQPGSAARQGDCRLHARAGARRVPGLGRVRPGALVSAQREDRCRQDAHGSVHRRRFR